MYPSWNRETSDEQDLFSNQNLWNRNLPIQRCLNVRQGKGLLRVPCHCTLFSPVKSNNSSATCLNCYVSSAYCPAWTVIISAWRFDVKKYSNCSLSSLPNNEHTEKRNEIRYTNTVPPIVIKHTIPRDTSS